MHFLPEHRLVHRMHRLPAPVCTPSRGQANQDFVCAPAAYSMCADRAVLWHHTQACMALAPGSPVSCQTCSCQAVDVFKHRRRRLCPSPPRHQARQGLARRAPPHRLGAALRGRPPRARLCLRCAQRQPILKDGPHLSARASAASPGAALGQRAHANGPGILLHARAACPRLAPLEAGWQPMLRRNGRVRRLGRMHLRFRRARPARSRGGARARRALAGAGAGAGVRRDAGLRMPAALLGAAEAPPPRAPWRPAAPSPAAHPSTSSRAPGACLPGLAHASA